MNAEDVTNENFDQFIRENLPVEEADIILGAFQCPDSCPRTCCKRGELQATMTEKEALDKIDPTVLEDATTSTEHGVSVYNIDFPCGFLNDDRCIAYKDRPWPCRMYPFQLSLEHPEHIAMNPCPLGAIINRYFGEFLRMLARNSTQELKLTTNRTIRYNAKAMKEGLELYHTDTNVPTVFISYPLFRLFSKAIGEIHKELPEGEMFKPSVFSQLEFNKKVADEQTL